MHKISPWLGFNKEHVQKPFLDKSNRKHLKFDISLLIRNIADDIQ